MKQNLLYITLFISTLLTGQEMKINIIPTPQKVIIPNDNDKFTFNEYVNITSNKMENSQILRSIRFLENELGNLLGINRNKKKGTMIELQIVHKFNIDYQIPAAHEEEAYQIEFEENNIIIRSMTPKGIFYGAQTLIQLIESSNSVIPIGQIIDWPNMKFRGISDDISRGQVSTIDNFKRIIRFLARYKMNTYMPYIEDMIEFETYPTIGKNRGALTKSEIGELVTYAKDHFIEVIPIFQTLGHFENILSQKEFIQYADFPGAASLDVTNKQTYQFLENLLLEVFDLFPSEYFHMGADESYDVGDGNSRSLVEEKDMATVHANHYKRVYDICKKNNKKVMMYGDIILSYPKILEEIPKDIIIVDWHYFPRTNYPSTKIFKDAGFDYIVSPTVWNFNATFPENFLAIPNIKIFTRDGIADNSIGMINSCWGDYGAETFRELNLYGYAWSAQCSWNIENSDIQNFNNTFLTDFYGGPADNFEKIYRVLSDPTNQVLWNDFWRHPLLEFRQLDWRAHKFSYPSKLYWMSTLDQDINFSELKMKITKNTEHFDLVEYVFKLMDFYSLKLETQQLLLMKLETDYVDIEKLADNVEISLEKLKALKTDYSKFWRKYNKEANLWMIEDKFNRLIAYFEEISNDLKTGDLHSSAIESKCIYFESEKDSIAENAIFKTELSIDSEVEISQLQFFADGHAKLFINDTFVDEVYVKRSGSLWLEQQRVKLIDIKKFLRMGTNEIKVEVDNYKRRNACCNVMGRIITENDTLKIQSDTEWLTTNNPNSNWKNASVNMDARTDITAPNFNKLRKSWIER